MRTVLKSSGTGARTIIPYSSFHQAVRLFQLNSNDSGDSPLNAGRFRVETGERNYEEVGRPSFTTFYIDINFTIMLPVHNVQTNVLSLITSGIDFSGITNKLKMVRFRKNAFGNAHWISAGSYWMGKFSECYNLRMLWNLSLLVSVVFSKQKRSLNILVIAPYVHSIFDTFIYRTIVITAWRYYAI